MKTLHPIEPLIVRVRGHRVVLDADLARLYGVTTKRFNEAFKRNRARFPGDFAFQLTQAEMLNLRSQIATSSLENIDLKDKSKKRPSGVTGTHGGRRYLPKVSTEHGAVMAATVLRSEQAVQMSVFVIRAFVRMREHVAANTAIIKRLAEIDKSLLEHDTALVDIYRKLLPLLQPEAAPRKRRIGFVTDNDE